MVIWIEPIPHIFQTLRQRIGKFPNQKAFNLLITDDVREYTFNISDQKGVSSSIFRFTPKHLDLWPIIHEEDTLKIVSTRLDMLLDEQEITPDTVVLDVEGAELLALKGMGSYLDHVRNLVVEYTTIPVLKGGVLFNELDEWICNKGFRLKEKRPVAAQNLEDPLAFGDALYIKDA
jgi:FkbM family methyltransferase